MCLLVSFVKAVLGALSFLSLCLGLFKQYPYSTNYTPRMREGGDKEKLLSSGET